MGFMDIIKKFLIRWDLMPILWPFGPKGQDGWIPLAIMAASAIAKGVSKYKGDKAANNADLAGQEKFNEWMKGIQERGGRAQDMFSAAGFDPFADRTSSGTQFSNTDSTTRSQYDRRSNPFVTGEFKPQLSMLKDIMSARVNDPGEDQDLIGRRASRTAALMNRAIDATGDRNLMLGKNRGTAGLDAQRAQAVAGSIDSSEDLLAARRRADEAALAGLGNTFFKGTHDRGTETSRTNQAMTGGSTNTGPADIGQIAQYFNMIDPAMPAPNAPMQTGNSPGWGLAGDLAGAAGQWYANRPTSGGVQPIQGAPVDPSNPFSVAPIDTRLKWRR